MSLKTINPVKLFESEVNVIPLFSHSTKRMRTLKKLKEKKNLSSSTFLLRKIHEEDLERSHCRRYFNPMLLCFTNKFNNITKSKLHHGKHKISRDTVQCSFTSESSTISTTSHDKFINIPKLEYASSSMQNARSRETRYFPYSSENNDQATFHSDKIRENKPRFLFAFSTRFIYSSAISWLVIQIQRRICFLERERERKK